MCDDTLSVRFVLVLDVVSFGGAMRGQANACSMSGAPRGTVPSGADVPEPRGTAGGAVRQAGRARRRGAGFPRRLGLAALPVLFDLLAHHQRTERKNHRKTFRSTKHNLEKQKEIGQNLLPRPGVLPRPARSRGGAPPASRSRGAPLRAHIRVLTSFLTNPCSSVSARGTRCHPSAVACVGVTARWRTAHAHGAQARARVYAYAASTRRVIDQGRHPRNSTGR